MHNFSLQLTKNFIKTTETKNCMKNKISKWLIYHVSFPILCRIHKFMDYYAKDIVGISAYDFYHMGDVSLVQDAHLKCTYEIMFFCIFFPFEL